MCGFQSITRSTKDVSNGIVCTVTEGVRYQGVLSNVPLLILFLSGSSLFFIGG